MADELYGLSDDEIKIIEKDNKMPRIDHHSKPYDEGTLIKLDIYSSYVGAWLPVFIVQPQIKEINIVDFFAGSGYDNNEKSGSPIRILEEINKCFNLLKKKDTIINLYLNEYDEKKHKKLQSNCNIYLDGNNKLKPFVKINYSNKDFDKIFKEIVEKTQGKPNLYIIDQSGVKFTESKYFNILLSLKKTDFLFFISSSFFNRFEKKVKSISYKFIHKTIFEEYRKLIPKNSILKIFPFSIKKKANVYGLIFGSKHVLGVDKFLKIAWDKNKINGEANYDIYDDKKKSQMDLFKDTKLLKIEGFQQNVEERVLGKKICNNSELLDYTYSQGHIPKHASDCLRQLKKDRKISYDGKSPLVTYENVYKYKKVMRYEIINLTR